MKLKDDKVWWNFGKSANAPVYFLDEEERARLKEEALLRSKQAKGKPVSQQVSNCGIRPANPLAQASFAPTLSPALMQQEEEGELQMGTIAKSPSLSATASKAVSKLQSTANKELGCVDFIHPEEGFVVFRRFSDKIAAGDRMPSDEVMLAMLEIGRAQFGEIEVYGTPEFVANAVRVAMEHNIVLHNKEYFEALEAQASEDKEASRPRRRLR